MPSDMKWGLIFNKNKRRNGLYLGVLGYTEFRYVYDFLSENLEYICSVFVA